MRWDIEKVFVQIKNALLEQKALAKSMNAKSIQAQMICMAHNLSLLMEKSTHGKYLGTGSWRSQRSGGKTS